MPNHAVPDLLVQANGRGKRSSWAMAREVSVTISVHPLRAPIPETTAMAAMNLPAQPAPLKIVWNALTNGAQAGAEQGRTADVDPGVLHPLGRHSRGLDADEGEQRNAGCDADAAVQAAARGVERAEVGRVHEEPPDDPDEQEG